MNRKSMSHSAQHALHVIKSFKHKGLKRYYETGSLAGIQPSQKKGFAEKSANP